MSATIEIADRAFRPIEVRSSSLNAEQRIIEVIFSTGAPVKRFAYGDGHYMETLSMDPAHVRLDRLNAGASFLDTHDQYSMGSRLGAVVPGSARVQNGIGTAKIQLSTSPAGEQLLGDLRQGLSLAVSVGYKTHSYERIDGDDETLPIYRAIDWEPMEISAVPIPADPGAMARAEPKATTSYAIVHDKRANRAVATRGVDMTEPNAETVDTRADEIMNFGKRYGASATLIKRGVDANMSLAEFRSQVLDAQIAAESRNATFSVSPAYGERGQEAPLADLMADGILSRINPHHKPSDAARQYAGLPMSELARRALEARGDSTRGASPGELITRALHTTSDFGGALSNVVNRQVKAGYEEVDSAIRQVAKQTTAKDFRAKSTVYLAETGGLEKVNEHGEFKRGQFTDGAELYAIDTFGKIFGVTRQALINDDLSLFDAVPKNLGNLASRFESKFLAELVEGGRRMSDGNAVFHADHRNLAATGSALSVASLAAGRLALRTQVGPGGEIVSHQPKFLIVPPQLELAGEQVLAVINAEKSDDVNPFSGKLTLLVEPHLKNETAWYLATDADRSGLEFAYLEGAQGPQTETRIGFDIDGTEWKVRLDFGAGWQDFRGFYKNPGQ